MQILDSYDVVVVGGGPAGVAAAAAAGRAGARTLLVERYGFVGGNSTAAMVYPWMTFHTAIDGTQVIRGFAQEVVDALAAEGGSPGHLRDTVGFVHTLTPYDGETYKRVAVRLLREAGVDLLLHSLLVDVECVGARVTAVRVANKAGQQTLRARVFVDTTGDADLAHLAGVPTTTGRSSDGATQPMTMNFRLTNVDVSAIVAYQRQHPDEFYEKSLIREVADGTVPLTGVSGFFSLWRDAALPIPRDRLLFFTGPGPFDVTVNTSRVSGNATRIEDWTRAEIVGREQVALLTRFFQDRVPGFREARLKEVPPQVGVRETRHVVGLYTLTGEDVTAGRRFDDVICRSGYPIDIHSASGAGLETTEIAGGGAYDIPYRCLVASETENLLVAGRCASTTHEAHASTRLTPSCMGMGQAAGVAAALAADRNLPAAEVPVGPLQDHLITAGADLGQD